MGRRSVITKDVAEQMLESFRTHPQNAAAAARAAGVDPRTSKKAWERGLCSCPDPRFHRPFQAIILEEQQEIRARVHREETEAAQLAAQAEASRRGGVHTQAIADVTKERAQEEHLVRDARAATIVLLNNVANMAAGATALGQKVRQSLETHASTEDVLSLNQSKMLVSLVGRLATSLRQLNDAGQKAMEMSRLLAGEPTSILGVAHLTAIPMVEAKERIAAAARAVAELEADGVAIIDAVH